MIKKLNNSGLTVVEILVCFSIVVVIVMSMFKVVNNQKAKQEIESTKNSMLTYKNEVTKTIEEDIIDGSGVKSCTINEDNSGNYNTYTLGYMLMDGSQRELIITQYSDCDENSKAEDVESEIDAVSDCKDNNYIKFYKGSILEDKLKIYVGFRHNDLGNKYSALDIVVPINKNWY